MNWIKEIFSKAYIIKDLFVFAWANKLWWMIPLLVVFIALGILIYFSQSSVATPFIYALF